MGVNTTRPFSTLAAEAAAANAGFAGPADFGSLEEMVEPNGPLLTELRVETAVAAEACELSGARSGDDEPFGVHLFADDGAADLEQKGAFAVGDRAAHALDGHECHRAVFALCLNHACGSLAFDVAGEGLRELYFDERGTIREIVEGRGHVLRDFGAPRCMVLLFGSHGSSLGAP